MPVKSGSRGKAGGKPVAKSKSRVRKPGSKSEEGAGGMVCSFCGREITHLPWVCRRCGGIFCADHYLPENHACPGVQERSWEKYARERRGEKWEVPRVPERVQLEPKVYSVKVTEHPSKGRKEEKRKIKRRFWDFGWQKVWGVYVIIGLIAVCLLDWETGQFLLPEFVLYFGVTAGVAGGIGLATRKSIPLRAVIFYSAVLCWIALLLSSRAEVAGRWLGTTCLFGIPIGLISRRVRGSLRRRRAGRRGRLVSGRVYLSLLVLCIFIDAGVFLYYRWLGEQEFKTRGEVEALEQENRALEENRALLSSRLENCLAGVQRLEAEKENLKWGDEYHLRDPLLYEAEELVRNRVSEPLENLFVYSQLGQLLYQAKKRGIRCAYVAVIVEDPQSGEEGSFELIGFNTLDNGMVYFEPAGYRVVPVVGKLYTDCVEGLPYISSGFVIRRVVTAW
jgi:hypothetical protein